MGWLWFLRFAHERGVIDTDERNALWDRVWAGLGEVAQAQRAVQEEQDPTRRFAQAILTALTSGHAHLAGPDGDAPSPADDPRAWGWRRRVVGGGEYVREEWQALGERIGWVDDGDIYLDAGATYGMAEAQARRGSGTLGVREVTLCKRLHEAGALGSVEQTGGKTYLQIRKTLGGRRHRVLHVRTAWLLEEKVGQVGRVGQPDDPPESESGPVANSGGQQIEPAGQKVATEVGQSGAAPQVRVGTAGQLGQLGQLSLQTGGPLIRVGAAVANGHGRALPDERDGFVAVAVAEDEDTPAPLSGRCPYGHQAAGADRWGAPACADPACPAALEGLWPTDAVGEGGR